MNCSDFTSYGIEIYVKIDEIVSISKVQSVLTQTLMQLVSAFTCSKMKLNHYLSPN